MANFSLSQKVTSEFEGGYFNDPSAGITYAGIAKNFHPEWLGFDRLVSLQKKFFAKRPIPRYTVFNDAVLDKLVHEFYAENFWPLTLGDHIENQVIANMVYDFFVHKQNDAIRVINDCAKVYSPGINTFQTKLSGDVVAVINQVPVKFYSTLREARINYYKTKNGFSNKTRRSFIARVNKFPLQLATGKKPGGYYLFSWNKIL